MSRRSLRLHTPPGEHGSPYGSASFSVGAAARREPAPSKSSRRQHLSVSCSQSLLLQTPHRHSIHPHHNSSLHSVASDASLLSSMLDESSVQERTLMESFWGFDEDVDPQDSTILSGASDTLANSTLVADAVHRYHPAQTQTSVINGHPCRDCAQPSDRKQAAGALRGLSGFPQPAPRPSAGALSTAAPLYSTAQNQGLPASRTATSPTSTIYCREKSRKGKLGVFVSVWDSARSVCSRITASLALLLTLSYRHTLLTKHLDHEASSRSGGGMDSGGPADEKLNQNQNDPLCEDPKDKPTTPSAVVSPSSTSFSPSSSSSSQSSSFLSSVLYLLLGLLWIASSSAGAYVWQLAQRAGSAGWIVTKKSVSDLRASGPSAGQVGSSVLHWLDRGWYHTVSLMSLLKDFLLVRCLPNLFKITLLLVLLLLLSVLLGWWDPRDVLSSMLGVDWADRQAALPLTSIPGLAAMLKPPREGGGQPAPGPPEQSTDLQTYAEPPAPPAPPAAAAVQEEEGEGEEDSPGDSERLQRLQRLEQSLSQLWERVEDGGHRAEQMHSEVLGLYQGLRQQQHTLVEQARVEQARVEQARVEQARVEQARVEQARADLEPWLDGLLEDKLAEMRVRLDEDRLHREQTRRQQKSQALRLAALEQLLQTLTAKMEHLQQVQQRQEAVATTLRTTPASRLPTAVSTVDGESHESLRSDVSRLEVALGTVRQDLKGLRGCQDHCERLDHLQETVREELRAALYGNQLVSLSQAAAGSPDDGGDRAALPDSLLQWLAERYVSGADLRASLASLELGILRNVSQQLLQRRRGEPATNGGDDDADEVCQTVVTQAVVDSLKVAGAGVTEEQVQLMVRNALRIYSQDRTGLADYALESGGGSILSTRCSETYETRTALLSLFGLPLWYFSQSPRVVIQPDVQPGNCWAFKGSTGYLVIRLSMKVQPTAFSLEHIPKALAPSGALRSAPRDFTVYGLDDEGQEEGTLLGSYSYEEDGEALQTYHVTEDNELAFQIIEVRILSNWGNHEYTCMYRLRVHGVPSNK